MGTSLLDHTQKVAKPLGMFTYRSVTMGQQSWATEWLRSSLEHTFDPGHCQPLAFAVPYVSAAFGAPSDVLACSILGQLQGKM